MLLSNILVAVDGSENSKNVLNFALGLAEKFNSSITILNVYEPLSMGAFPQEQTSYPVGNIAGFDKDIRKIHEEILSKTISQAKATEPDLIISTMLNEGDPALEIVNTAKEGAFDVIVVGHKGAGGLSERFLGSVSEKVAHLSPCPVIIVR